VLATLLAQELLRSGDVAASRWKRKIAVISVMIARTTETNATD
jgi:aspartokinase-like uncharacterized kinase